MTTPDNKQFEFPEGHTPEEERDFIHQVFVLAFAVAKGAGGIIKLGLSFLDNEPRSTDSNSDSQSG